MGGLENGVVNLINRSDSNRFEHMICCFSTTGTAEKRLKYKIPVFEMHKKDGNDWGMMLRLFKLMKQEKPDIVHTRNWGSVDAIVPAKLAGVPHIIHSEHGWNNDDPRGRNIKRRATRKLLSYLIDHFIAVSNDIRNWLVDSVGIKPTKVRVVINGVDIETFKKGDKKKAKKRLGFPENEFIIGTVGRLRPIKNQKILLEAFSKLNHDIHSLSLIIVGEGPERASLTQLKNGLFKGEKIHLLGLRNDIPQILNMFDIFVLPSKSEGICNTILEAMASSLPVVATDVGGNAELVRNGFNGFLIPSNDPDSLTDFIDRYLNTDNELVDYHGKNSRDRAASYFSLDTMVKSYEKIYKTCVTI